jgi:hypothetical protein
MASDLFNSALETGMRALIVLAAAYPTGADLQRLVAYDYLLVHSADADGPKSLHPSTPQRNGELLVRHTLIQNGLFLLLSRNLVERCASEGGIEYYATDAAQVLLDSLGSEYVHALRDRAEWVVSKFTQMTDAELRNFLSSHLDKWTTEFELAAIPGEAL